MKDLAVFILCGGKKSQEQSEKGLILFKDKPFVEHIIKAILPITNNIQLVTNSNDYDYLNYKIIRDIEIDKGPLGGIYTALYYSEAEFSMILSCDIPLISTELLSELIEKHDDEAVITVLSSESRVHPLIGIYAKKILPHIKEAIDRGDLKLMNLIVKLPHQIISFDENQNLKFMNINSLDELNDLDANLNSML